MSKCPNCNRAMTAAVWNERYEAAVCPCGELFDPSRAWWLGGGDPTQIDPDDIPPGWTWQSRVIAGRPAFEASSCVRGLEFLSFGPFESAISRKVQLLNIIRGIEGKSPIKLKEPTA